MLRVLWSALTALVVAGASTPLAFWLAIAIAPNRTAEGYGLMPIGQAALAMLCGVILGVIAALVTHRRLRR